MKKAQTAFLLIVLSIFIGFNQLIAQNFALDSNVSYKPVVDILIYTLIGQPNVGDTVILQVQFKANITSPAIIGITFDSTIAPINVQPNEKFRIENISLDSGQIYNRNYLLKVNKSGYTTINFIARLALEKSGFEFLTSHQIQVYSDISNGNVILKTNPNDDIPRMTFDEIFKNLSVTGGNHSFTIHGSVKYYDWWCQGCGQQPILKTTYPEIRLWFHSNVNTQWEDNRFKFFTPFDPTTNGYLEGVQYAIPDDNGNFTFSFQINSNIDPNEQYEIWIMSCKENDEIDLFSGNDNQTVNMISNPNRTPNPATTIRRCFNEIVSMRKLQIDLGTTQHTYDFTSTPLMINDEDGQIMRFTTLTKKFVDARFDNAKTFNLPFVTTTRVDVPNNQTKINWYSSLNIQQESFKRSLIIHEYGHYVHHAMSNFQCGQWCGNRDKTEGFAKFMVDAVTSWLSNTLQFEDFLINESAELAPFDYSNGYRFSNIGNQSNIAEVEFDCYLWNVYDNYVHSDFMPPMVNHTNNDDVSNMDKFLFQKFADNAVNENTPVQFNTYFKNQLNDQDLSTSVQNIFNCLFAQDQNNPPPMRPAQVINPTNCSTGNDWFVLCWQTQSYSNGTIYRNYETGYHIYQLDGTTWNQIGDQPAGTTSFGIYVGNSNNDNTYGSIKYKISAYNSSGDSYNPIEYTFTWDNRHGERIVNLNPNLVNSNISETNIYPNPVVDHARIEYNISSESELSFDLLDCNVNQISSLINKKQNAGNYEFNFVIDKNLANGVYFIKQTEKNINKISIKLIKFILNK